MKRMFRLNGNADNGYIDCIYTSGNKQDICALWNKLVDYATYWETHTPTCNGNIDFIGLENFIKGFICAKRWEIYETHTKIIIKNGRGSELIVMTKRPKPKEYFEKIEEINLAINSLLGY